MHSARKPTSDGISVRFLRRRLFGMIIGSGIFAGPSIVARYTDSSGLTMLVWVICGLMSFCGAVSYAELGGMMPRAGGVFVYLKEAYGPLWAFLFGWTSLLAVRPANMAAIAIVFSTYLGFFITPQSGLDDA